MESRLSHRPPCRFRGRISRYASMGRIEKRQETIVVPTQTGKETRRPFSDKCRLEDSRRASMESCGKDFREKVYAYEGKQPPHKVADGIQKRMHDGASLKGKYPVRRVRCGI